MFKRICLIALTTFSLGATADLTIFDTRKTLPMADGDQTYRDFLINSGSESGLSEGMVLTVQRRMPLYDSYQNRSAGDLMLKVAKIKIIHVQKGLAVARLHSDFTREATPILEDNFIMVGDRLDLSSASSDKKADAAPAKSDAVASGTSATIEKTAARIVVNSVELSSSAPMPKVAPTSLKVDVPVRQ